MRHCVWILGIALLAACFPAEASPVDCLKIPASLNPEAHIQVPEPEPKPEKTAYITIDDGPSEDVTPRILDILKEQDIKATFFVLPREATKHIMERIIREGHQLGNHSYSHDYNKLYRGDSQLFREEVLHMQTYLETQFGYQTSLFRFPGGSQSWDPAAIAARRDILQELHYRDFDWDISLGDTDPSPAGRDPKVLAANVSGNLKGQEKLILLMHDSPGKTATAEALPEIIETLREKGYGFDVLGNYDQA